VENFRGLKVYKDSFDLALAIYQRARKFPWKEAGELVSQLRRAALSIPLNVAEGYGRRVSQKDFTRFVTMAIGSVNETMVLLEFAHRLGFLDAGEYKAFDDKYEILLRRLKALYARLREKK
jgi:four helix bundle protein